MSTPALLILLSDRQSSLAVRPKTIYGLPVFTENLKISLTHLLSASITATQDQPDPEHTIDISGKDSPGLNMVTI